MSGRATEFRRLLEAPGLVEAPGAFDAQTARLVELAGFPAVTLGGASLIASAFGLPDIGIASLPEVIGVAGRITSVLDVPVILDLDDGGGNPLRARRFIRLVEEAGIAAVHIEDVDFAGGKHLAGKGGLATTYTFEPPGDIHTLEVPADVTEMATLFHVTGAYIYVGADGRPTGIEDVFSKIGNARAHYERTGLGAGFVDQFIR